MAKYNFSDECFYPAEIIRIEAHPDDRIIDKNHPCKVIRIRIMQAPGKASCYTHPLDRDPEIRIAIRNDRKGLDLYDRIQKDIFNAFLTVFCIDEAKWRSLISVKIAPAASDSDVFFLEDYVPPIGVHSPVKPGELA